MAVLRGGHSYAPVRALPPHSYEIFCKVARLHNCCRPIHSVASQLVSNYTTHSIIRYVIRNSCPPNTDVVHPAGHPKLLQLEKPLIKRRVTSLRGSCLCRLTKAYATINSTFLGVDQRPLCLVMGNSLQARSRLASLHVCYDVFSTRNRWDTFC